MNISTTIALFRAPHYIKNLFIFAPIFFAGMLNNIDLLLASCLAFLAFSLSASAIYIFNDYQDIEQDKLHEKKQHRPLASEKITIHLAFSIMISLLIISLALMYWLSTNATLVLVAYIVSNIAYSLKLKHVAIIDINLIALGFVFRLFIGALVTGIILSHWIVIITYLLALFLALSKRRDDVLIYTQTGVKNRTVIDGYNLQFLDTTMSIMGAVVIVAYIIYTSSDLSAIQSEYLYLTSFFVIIGILRYLQITLVEEKSSSPTQVVLQDKPLLICILLWLMSFGVILYS